MVKKITIFGWLAIIALVVLATPVRAEVVYFEDFEAYATVNPALAADMGNNWTPSNTATNATRIFQTSTTYDASKMWISNVDGSGITSAGIAIESDTYYTFSSFIGCESFGADRGLDASYDLLVGSDIGSATTVISGPVLILVHGDDYDIPDSKEDQIFTSQFATGTLNAGDKLFVVISHSGTAAGYSDAWFAVDDVTLDKGGSTMGPGLVSPLDGAILVDVAVDLTWTAPLVGTPDTYTLLYKDDPNTAVPFTEVTGLTTLSNAPGLSFDTTYYWAVDAIHAGTPYRSATWSFTTSPANPVITAEPVSVTVAAGAPATLTVEQLNGASFQWYKDGAPVGTSSPTLSIASTQTTDEGVYYCDVINGAGTVSSANAVVMTARQVAHWDFESSSLVDSIDGWVGVFTDPNTANDLPDPAARFIAGYDGSGFDFAGDTLHLEVQGTEGLFNFYENGFTVACWVQAGTESTGSFSAMVAKHTYSAPRSGLIVSQQNSTGRARLTVDQNVALYGPSESIANVQDGSWHHVVMTYEPGYDPENPDSKRSRVYVDGGGVTYDVDENAVWLRSTGTTTGNPTAMRWDVPLRIGCDDEAGAGSLDGTVDEVKIWSYALTPTEVADEYTTYEIGAEICTDVVALDYNNDCEVNLADLAIFIATWLDCNIVPDCN